MKKNLFSFLFLASLVLISCSSDNEPQSGGTLKITASTGTSKTLSNYKQTLAQGCFYCTIDEPNSTDNYYWIAIGGFTDAGQVDIYVGIPTIQTGKIYTYLTNSGNNETNLSIDFEDWIETDYSNTTKATIEFSNFQYPGRITGVVINYDKNGKVLAKGEFDFVSVKPAT